MSQQAQFLTAPWDERRSGERLDRPNDWRAWYDRDRARLIHCAGLRRLQAKMQALGVAGMATFTGPA
jgi:dGTP triphosphohydrolase